MKVIIEVSQGEDEDVDRLLELAGRVMKTLSEIQWVLQYGKWGNVMNFENAVEAMKKASQEGEIKRFEEEIKKLLGGGEK